MTVRKEHKGLYYIPGILTLAILPIFFTAQIANYIERTKEYIITITVPFADKNEDNSRFDIPGAPAERQYLIIEFTEDKKADSLKLILIENILRGIEISHDTTYGIKMLFNEKLKYRTLIGAINACLKSKINTYFIQSDTLVTYHRLFTSKEDTTSFFPSPDYSKIILIDFLDINIPEQPQSIRDVIVENKRILIISTIYMVWFIIIAYLNIRKLVKTNEW